MGDCNVGKSSIIKMFLEKQFNEKYDPTIMGEIFSLYTKFNGEIFNFQVYATSSDNVYKKLSHYIWKDCSFFILVYDITNKETYKHIDLWLKELEKLEIKADIILVGNNTDLKENRAVKKEEAEKEYGSKVKSFGIFFKK